MHRRTGRGQANLHDTTHESSAVRILGATRAAFRTTGGSAASLSIVTLVAMAALALVSSSVASAQGACDRNNCGFLTQQCGGYPATPTPVPGTELQPTDSSPLPANRDSTSFDEFHGGRYAVSPFFMDVEPVNGYLFLLQAWRFQIWDTHADPANPTSIGSLEWTSFPSWPAGEPKWPLSSVSAPPGTDSLAAISGPYGFGVAIVDTTDKTRPKLLYQGNNKDGFQVYAATINGGHYAFLADNGLTVLNMDNAKQYTGCLEDLNSPGACPGVYQTTVATRSNFYVHGVANFVVTSSGSGFGVDILDVSNPASPQLKLSLLPGVSVYGVAMWQNAGHTYAAARAGLPLGAGGTKLNVFDVSCLASGGCSQPPPALSVTEFDEVGTSDYTLSFSRDGNNTPFLYLGSDDRCGTPTLQREWLLDMSNPAAPRDITPAPAVIGGQLQGYWGHYYHANPTGFNGVDPRRGKFGGNYFYRMGMYLFDIHQHVGQTQPVAAFSWSPSQIYPGTQVTFTDLSTGGQHTDAWTFVHGTPSSSTASSPTVAFDQAGSWAVGLTAANNVGNNTVSQNVTVLSPAPQVASIVPVPASPLQCQPVVFTANATGQPPLTYSWTVVNGSNLTVGSGTGNPFTWDTKAAGAPSASYTAKLTVSGIGSINATQPFSLGGLALLPASGTFTPTNDSFTSGTVQFHVNVAGATEWSWDFGDGAGFTGWSTDPSLGPNPSHTYTSTGAKAVKVQVRNCVNLGPITSGTLNINIIQTTPLVANFTPVCSFAPCVFSAGSPLNFTDSSTGAEKWYYDWEGTGTFDGGQTAPVTSHVYPNPGFYKPVLKVTRGASESNTFVYTTGITIAPSSPPPSPSISVGGPNQGSPSTSYSFAASAANCTPSPTWTWTVSGGGAISGDATQSSITVSWPAAGSYNVSATNSGCSGTSGIAYITISSGTTGGGVPLKAQFTFSPPAPKTGDTVNFDSSSSAGNPATVAWTFGDGSSGTGATTTHVYQAAGSFVVTLNLTKPGEGVNCFFGTCAASATQTVVVTQAGPPPPPPLNPDYSVSPITCVNQFGFDSCQAATAQKITFTGLETRAVTFAWDFGDGSTGSGQAIDHTWTQPGSYTVALKVSAPNFSDQTKSRTVVVSGPPPPPPTPTQTVLLPWIAETRGALLQSSDLYVHNPDSGPVDVTLTFLKRGTPETSPPKVTQTLQPGQTLFAPNVLSGTFSRENAAGFITVSAKTNTAPIITAYNTTSQSTGLQFGQTVPGVTVPQAATSAASSATGTQQLIGLNDNADQLSYFGLSNPGATVATYHLRFFDASGLQLSDSGPADLVLGPQGQRQYQLKDIHQLFGVANASDYRVQIETTSGGQIFPYASNIRLGTGDPAYLPVGMSTNSRLYVLGAFTSNNWQSDLVLANSGNLPVTTSMTFTKVGYTANPSPPVTVNLQPGQTQRLTNALAAKFGASNAVGVITLDSTAATGVYPIVQAESYNNADPGRRYGQAMPALADADAADTGKSQYLVGLRQDASNRLIVWLFNPSADFADYDVIYRNLDGSVIATLSDVPLAPGRARQFLPGQHPIPVDGVQGGFTVQINVKAGKVLSAAQVVNATSGAPAYIKGIAR